MKVGIVFLALITLSHGWTFEYDDDQLPVLDSEPDASDLDTLDNDGLHFNADLGDDLKAEKRIVDVPPLEESITGEPAASESSLPIFDSKNKIEEGRQRYELIKSEAPKYGICWTNAIQSLHVGCARLNDESQARMGLSFANCFLEKVGSKTYPCSIDNDIKSCVQSMDDRAFNTYTHFYTHTQSICFFLANQVWQESTSKVVHTLKDTSIKVSERLIKLQDLQEESISTQVSLNQKMSESKSTLESFGQSLKEKQMIETEILRRFLEIKEFILSELSKFYSIGFYLIAMITVYLITTPVRTNSARFWVLILFAGNLAIERYVVSNVLTIDGQGSYDVRGIRDVSSEIDESTWICRKATCLIAALVIFIFWITYKDYGQLNHVLLSQIREHNLDLKKSASEIKSLQFLQLQRMGVQSPPIGTPANLCFDDSKKDSDVVQEEPELARSYLDIMSDFSDLDSGHEDETDSVTRIKVLNKRIKKEPFSEPVVSSPTTFRPPRAKSSNRKPDIVTVNQSNVLVYSPTTTYNLRERKTRPQTPITAPTKTPIITEYSDQD